MAGKSIVSLSHEARCLWDNWSPWVGGPWKTIVRDSPRRQSSEGSSVREIQQQRCLSVCPWASIAMFIGTRAQLLPGPKGDEVVLDVS